VFWDIKPQNQSSGLTPGSAEKQIKKAQTINISPLRGGHASEPIDMPFGVLSRVPDVITHAKFCVNRLRGFSAATARKVPFSILFWTTLTTVLHYRADCDFVEMVEHLSNAVHWHAIHAWWRKTSILDMENKRPDTMTDMVINKCVRNR